MRIFVSLTENLFLSVNLNFVFKHFSSRYNNASSFQGVILVLRTKINLATKTKFSRFYFYIIIKFLEIYVLYDPWNRKDNLEIAFNLLYFCLSLTNSFMEICPVTTWKFSVWSNWIYYFQAIVINCWKGVYMCI